MARSKVRCPSCEYPIALLESHADADSIECPNCRGRVYLRAERHTPMSNDQRAAFTGWTSAGPHSVQETVHEDAPQYIVQDGVTKKIVRRVFRRIVRRTVRVGSDGQRVQWEVDWSWLPYLIYGIGICLAFAVVIFGPGYNWVRQVADVVTSTDKGSDNPFVYMTDQWRSFRFVDVARLQTESVAQSSAVSPLCGQMRLDGALAAVFNEVRRAVETVGELGAVQAIEFKSPIPAENFAIGRAAAAGGGVSIYKSGQFFVFQPAGKLLVRSTTLEGARAALERMGARIDNRPRIEPDEDAVDWVRTSTGDTSALKAATSPLAGLAPGILDGFEIRSVRVDIHLAAKCRVRSVMETADAASAASLAGKLNEAKSAIKTYHAKQRSFGGMRMDSPEHAALSILEAGDFVARSTEIRGEAWFDAAVLVAACQAIDGGMDLDKLAKSLNISPEPVLRNNAKPNADAVGTAVASRTPSDRKVDDFASAASPKRNLGMRGLNFDSPPTIEQAREKMIETFGKERVVTVAVEKLPENYPHSAMVDFLTRSNGGTATAMCAVGQGNQLQVVFAPAVDLAGLAGQISFGEVDFDLEKRILKIQVSRGDSLPRGKRPGPRPLQEPRNRQQFGEARIEQLLAEVQKQQNNEGVRTPLAELADAVPISELRGKVCDALLVSLDAGRKRAADDYAKAFANWAEARHVPKLVEMMDGQNSTALTSIFYCLAAFKDESSFVPMARHFPRHYLELGPVFESIGDAAEPTVMALLEGTDPAAVAEAIRVLKVIGTKASIPGLEKVATRLPQTAPDAREAIGFIQQSE